MSHNSTSTLPVCRRASCSDRLAGMWIPTSGTWRFRTRRRPRPTASRNPASEPPSRSTGVRRRLAPPRVLYAPRAAPAPSYLRERKGDLEVTLTSNVNKSPRESEVTSHIIMLSDILTLCCPWNQTIVSSSSVNSSGVSDTFPATLHLPVSIGRSACGVPSPTML